MGGPEASLPSSIPSILPCGERGDPGEEGVLLSIDSLVLDGPGTLGCEPLAIEGLSRLPVGPQPGAQLWGRGATFGGGGSGKPDPTPIKDEGMGAGKMGFEGEWPGSALAAISCLED